MSDEMTPGIGLGAASPSTPTPVHADFAKPPAAPGENRTPPAPAPVAVAAPTVQFTMDQVQHFMGLERKLADIETANQAVLEAAKQAELLAMAKAGDSERALDEQRKIGQTREAEALKKYKDLETQVFSEKADAVLSSALNGCVFAGQDDASRAAAARMLKTVLQADIEAVRLADGSIQVRDKVSGRPAAEVLRERLVAPDLAFFFAPNSRGGSGSDGARPPANQQQPQPGSLAEIAASYKARQGQFGGARGLSPTH